MAHITLSFQKVMWSFHAQPDHSQGPLGRTAGPQELGAQMSKPGAHVSNRPRCFPLFWLLPKCLAPVCHTLCIHLLSLFTGRARD